MTREPSSDHLSEFDFDPSSEFDFDSDSESSPPTEVLMNSGVVPDSQPCSPTPIEYFSCEEAVVPEKKKCKRVDPVLREPPPKFVTKRWYSPFPEEHTRAPKTYAEFLNNIKWDVAEDIRTSNFSPQQLYDEMLRRENIAWNRLTKRVKDKWTEHRVSVR